MVGDDLKAQGDKRMTDEIKKDVTETKAEPKAEIPKEPTIEELKAQIKALEATAENNKKATSKACEDAAEWKRKYRATLDEAERVKQEQADRAAEMEAKLKAYEQRETAQAYANKLMSAGYTFEAATKMAEDLPIGIPDSFFEQQKAFLEAQKQAIKTEKINSQPNLPVGSALSAADAMSAKDAELRKKFGL